MTTAVASKPVENSTCDRSHINDLWIVLAAYNEEQRLSNVLLSLCQRFNNIAVVDDGSQDRSSEVAAQHRVWNLRHVVNLGQGAALQTGINFALSRGARYIVTFDSDGQHVAEDVERLLQPIHEGWADVCLGSRFLGRTVDLPWHRWLVLKVGVAFTRLFSRVNVTDTHNGLRAFSRHAASRIQITQNRMAHASEILDQIRACQLRYVEVPVTVKYSHETVAKGQSSWEALRVGMQFLLGRMIR